MMAIAWDTSHASMSTITWTDDDHDLVIDLDLDLRKTKTVKPPKCQLCSRNWKLYMVMSLGCHLPDEPSMK